MIHQIITKDYSIVVLYDPRQDEPVWHMNYFFEQTPLYIGVAMGRDYPKEMYKVSNMIEDVYHYTPVIHPYLFQGLGESEATSISAKIIAATGTVLEGNGSLYNGYFDKGDPAKIISSKKRGWQKGLSLTTEHKSKISKSLTGKKYRHHNRTPESMMRFGNTNGARNFIVIDPRGNRQMVYNLTEYCREKNLDVAHLNNVAQGLRKHHRQFRCLKAEIL